MRNWSKTQIRGSPYWMSFSELQMSEIHIIFVNIALSMHTREKNNPFLTKEPYLYRLTKVLNTTQYPAKHDL